MEQQLQIPMDFKLIGKTMCHYCQIYHGETHTTTLLIHQMLIILMKTRKLINHLKLLISLYAIRFKMCSIILFEKNRGFAVSIQR